MTEAMEYEEQLGDEQFVDEAAEGYEEIDDIEEEGDIAADYLEELLDIADLDGDIDIEVRNNRIYLSVVNDDDDNEELRHLVGRHGEVLDALQELVRLSVLAGNGTRSRLILDIAGYRASRVPGEDCRRGYREGTRYRPRRAHEAAEPLRAQGGARCGSRRRPVQRVGG